MYKLLTRSLTRPEKSLANFTSIYRKVAKNHLSLHNSTTTQPDNNPNKKKRIVRAKSSVSVPSRKAFIFPKRPWVPERKETVHIMMFSTSSSKYFYASTLNEAKQPQNFFKNQKALDMYKKAVEQCMKIKFQKHRIQGKTRNVAWTPPPFKTTLETAPSTTLVASTPPKKKLPKPLEVEDMKELVKQKKALQYGTKKKLPIVYPTHSIKHKLGMQKPYQLEEKPRAQEPETVTKPQPPADLVAVMRARRKRDEKLIADVDKAVQQLINQHPAMKTVSESAKMSINKKYNIILLKSQAKIKLQMKTKEISAEKSEELEVLPKENEAELEENEARRQLDNDLNIVQHPISTNPDPVDLQLMIKHPKRLLAEKNDTFDIEEICLKTKESYIVHADETADVINKINENRNEIKALVHKAAETVDTKQDQKIRKETPVRVGDRKPGSSAQNLSAYLKKLHDLKEQSSMEKSSIRKPFTKKEFVEQKDRSLAESTKEVDIKVKPNGNAQQENTAQGEYILKLKNEKKEARSLQGNSKNKMKTTSKYLLENNEAAAETEAKEQRTKLQKLMSQYIVKSAQKSQEIGEERSKEKEAVAQKAPKEEYSPHNEEKLKSISKYANNRLEQKNVKLATEKAPQTKPEPTEKMSAGDHKIHKGKLKNLLEPANQYLERLKEASENQIKTLKDQFKSQIAENISKGLKMKNVLENMPKEVVEKEKQLPTTSKDCLVLVKGPNKEDVDYDVIQIELSKKKSEPKKCASEVLDKKNCLPNRPTIRQEKPPQRPPTSNNNEKRDKPRGKINIILPPQSPRTQSKLSKNRLDKTLKAMPDKQHKEEHKKRLETLKTNQPSEDNQHVKHCSMEKLVNLRKCAKEFEELESTVFKQKTWKCLDADFMPDKSANENWLTTLNNINELQIQNKTVSDSKAIAKEADTVEKRTNSHTKPGSVKCQTMKENEEHSIKGHPNWLSKSESNFIVNNELKLKEEPSKSTENPAVEVKKNTAENGLSALDRKKIEEKGMKFYAKENATTTRTPARKRDLRSDNESFQEIEQCNVGKERNNKSNTDVVGTKLKMDDTKCLPQPVTERNAKASITRKDDSDTNLLHKKKFAEEVGAENTKSPPSKAIKSPTEKEQQKESKTKLTQNQAQKIKPPLGKENFARVSVRQKNKANRPQTAAQFNMSNHNKTETKSAEIVSVDKNKNRPKSETGLMRMYLLDENEEYDKFISELKEKMKQPLSTDNANVSRNLNDKPAWNHNFQSQKKHSTDQKSSEDISKKNLKSKTVDGKLISKKKSMPIQESKTCSKKSNENLKRPKRTKSLEQLNEIEKKAIGTHEIKEFKALQKSATDPKMCSHEHNSKKNTENLKETKTTEARDELKKNALSPGNLRKSCQALGDEVESQKKLEENVVRVYIKEQSKLNEEKTENNKLKEDSKNCKDNMKNESPLRTNKDSQHKLITKQDKKHLGADSKPKMVTPSKNNSKKPTDTKPKPAKSLEELNKKTDGCFSDYFERAKEKPKENLTTTRKKDKASPETIADEEKIKPTSLKASKVVNREIKPESVTKDTNFPIKPKPTDEKSLKNKSDSEKNAASTDALKKVDDKPSNMSMRAHETEKQTKSSDTSLAVVSAEKSETRVALYKSEEKTNELIKTNSASKKNDNEITSKESTKSTEKMKAGEEKNAKPEVVIEKPTDDPTGPGKKKKVILRLSGRPTSPNPTSEMKNADSKKDTNKTEHQAKIKEILSIEPRTVLDYIIDNQLKKRNVKPELMLQEAKILKQKYHDERLQKVMDRYRIDTDRFEDHQKIIAVEEELLKRKQQKENDLKAFKRKISEETVTKYKKYETKFEGYENNKMKVKSQSCLLKNKVNKVKLIARAKSSKYLLENQVDSMKTTKTTENNQELKAEKKKVDRHHKYSLEKQLSEKFKPSSSRYSLENITLISKKLHSDATTKTSDKIKAVISDILPFSIIDNHFQFGEMLTNADLSSLFHNERKKTEVVAEIKEIFHQKDKLLKFNKKLVQFCSNQLKNRPSNEFLVADDEKKSPKRKLLATCEGPTMEKELPKYPPEEKKEHRRAVVKTCDKLCIPPKTISDAFYSGLRDDITTLTKGLENKILSVPHKHSEIGVYEKYKGLKISFITVRRTEKKRSEQFLPTVLSLEHETNKKENCKEKESRARILEFRRELLKKLKEEFDFLNNNQTNVQKMRRHYENVLKENSECGDNKSLFKFPLMEKEQPKQKEHDGKNNVPDSNLSLESDFVPKNSTELLIKKLNKKGVEKDKKVPEKPDLDPKRK